MRRSYLHKPLPRRQKRRRFVVLAVLVVGIIGVIFAHQRPHSPIGSTAIPHAEAKSKPSTFTANPTWPQDSIAAAIGVAGEGVLATHGDQEQRPIASIAKVITALVILEKHPLKTGEAGPLIPIHTADEQRYRDYIAQNGSVIPVQAGVSLTLYQTLQAMLLPSANNISDTAAVWAFGSMHKYHNAANNFLRQHELTRTKVGGDASGLDPATKSTTKDLLRIAQIALNHPVVAQIVQQKEATIPFAGTIPNYNRLVTQYGFSGIKPGDSNEAGVTMLFSKQHLFKGENLQIVGVILGGGASYAQEDALHLMESVEASLKKR